MFCERYTQPSEENVHHTSRQKVPPPQVYLHKTELHHNDIALWLSP